MHSALYRGWVRHRRHGAGAHAFRFPLFMVYLDLAELDRVFAGRRLWSTSAPALARFRREDHFGDPSRPLDQVVRDTVAGALGWRPAGPVRLLTHLRYLGHRFDPVSFYYCFAPDGEHLEAVLAEVTSTPWGERHVYVLEARPGAPRRGFRASARKAMHVSPFLPMDLDYDFRVRPPDDRLVLHIDVRRGPAHRFDATLVMRRQAITGASLRAALLRYPLMTLQVLAAIHYQAARLWLKGNRVFAHPRRHPVNGQGVH